ncbi:hypothetical protein N7495_007241 [Penicillium taxi]|uniref:uncharacterized protein n=1 Tax=Penicillium taxi TaxID=168475 RepID=UPI002545278C|nr:uncharacterized protein N7495_007241 [Penicillium taxi]KAJ5895550.1 hypothetical protein N7495_007241 [Penicillium taxi]
MRYEHWDVLLFPEGSKVPIQEFKTQCFVTKDTDSPYLQDKNILPPSMYYGPQGNFGQIPVLTTFIPSLPKDSPFRVSIHSWDTPRPSRLIEGLMQPDDMFIYEARIFIDGEFSAGGIFGQRTQWPFVIDLGSDIDRNGNRANLRFPDWHPEILEHPDWDASDTHGRIKVVIAEGFSRPHRSPPFERIKDVIVLAFQHAPKDILEYSNIAWPNPCMWTRVASQTRGNYNSATAYGDTRERADEIHGHSPSKPQPGNMARIGVPVSTAQQPVYNAWVSSRAFPIPASQAAEWQAYQRRTWYPEQPGPEPFMNQPTMATLTHDPVWDHQGARSSREDVLMPDYSNSSLGSRAISSTTGISSAMSGVSYEHSQAGSVSAPMNEEQYNLLIQSLTPTKPSSIGLHALSNTPAIAIMPAPKTSAAAQARSASYSRSARSSALREVSQTSGRSSVLRDVSQTSGRKFSGSSIDLSKLSETTASLAKIRVSPNGNIKGKKEGNNLKDTPKKITKDKNFEEILEEFTATPTAKENTSISPGMAVAEEVCYFQEA